MFRPQPSPMFTYVPKQSMQPPSPRVPGVVRATVVLQTLGNHNDPTAHPAAITPENATPGRSPPASPLLDISRADELGGEHCPRTGTDGGGSDGFGRRQPRPYHFRFERPPSHKGMSLHLREAVITALQTAKYAVFVAVHSVVTVVVVSAWLVMTVYIFAISYVVGVAIAILKRCPAVMRAALRGAQKTAVVAVGAGVMAYKATRLAYRTASKVWADWVPENSLKIPSMFKWTNSSSSPLGATTAEEWQAYDERSQDSVSVPDSGGCTPKARCESVSPSHSKEALREAFVRAQMSGWQDEKQDGDNQRQEEEHSATDPTVLSFSSIPPSITTTFATTVQDKHNAKAGAYPTPDTSPRHSLDQLIPRAFDDKEESFQTVPSSPSPHSVVRRDSASKEGLPQRGSAAAYTPDSDAVENWFDMQDNELCPNTHEFLESEDDGNVVDPESDDTDEARRRSRSSRRRGWRYSVGNISIASGTSFDSGYAEPKSVVDADTDAEAEEPAFLQ